MTEAVIKSIDWFLYDNGLRHGRVKKRLWHRCFSVNKVTFLRTPFLTDQLWWLLLKIRYTAFLAIAITITLDVVEKTTCCDWKSRWCCFLYTSTMTTKTFKQTFTSRIATFIWWYVDYSGRGLSCNKKGKEKL